MTQNTTRKLARIVKIDDINPITGADAIEVASVGGWKVVVKKGEFQVGDLAVYCEIDSWIPHGLAPFLSKGQLPREYNGVKGERLRTVKLRGQVSQGLLLPFSAFPSSLGFDYANDKAIGEDLTELLGIQKWEAPISPQLAGVARGNFPSFIRKTDQERIQNLKKDLEDWTTDIIPDSWEVTEKLDGSSMTVFFHEGQFGVCSRNLELQEVEGNTFWNVANRLGLKETLPKWENVAIQGELVGPGIQGNKYNLTEHKFFVYDAFNTQTHAYLLPEARNAICLELGLDIVPIVANRMIMDSSTTVDKILKDAEGKSALNPNTEREGVVYRCHNMPVSFKAISNKFLLKGGE